MEWERGSNAPNEDELTNDAADDVTDDNNTALRDLVLVVGSAQCSLCSCYST